MGRVCQRLHHGQRLLELRRDADHPACGTALPGHLRLRAVGGDGAGLDGFVGVALRAGRHAGHHRPPAALGSRQQQHRPALRFGRISLLYPRPRYRVDAGNRPRGLSARRSGPDQRFGVQHQRSDANDDAGGRGQQLARAATTADAGSGGGLRLHRQRTGYFAADTHGQRLQRAGPGHAAGCRSGAGG